MRFAIKPPQPCRAGSPEPDLFVIRRAQTTEGGDACRYSPAHQGGINTELSKWFRDTPSNSVFPVGETSWSRCNRWQKATPPFIVARGPVPRHRPRTPTLAGDRPPRYGKKTPPLHRSARACPSPCVLLSNRLNPVGQDRLSLTCL